jgi:[histone H3]-lysine36 N-dimethyltransferase SETMAR
MPHPAYSPDLNPCDFKFFRTLQHHLNGHTYPTRAALENAVIEYFQNLPAGYYVRALANLPFRWQSVIDHDGDYFE